MNSVTIVGGGLAGCEAALQLAYCGYDVTLFDLKPDKIIEPYKIPTYAELVCNNSIGNIDHETPLGMLLEELKTLGCKVLEIAEECRIDDPTFFSVDKKLFSRKITEELYKKNVKIFNKYIDSVPNDDNVLIATGPLTDELLISDISSKFGIEEYHFSDASSPVVDIGSVDLADRDVNRITDDLYVISISSADFRLFYEELIKQAEREVPHDIDKTIDYEKCQSIEQLAKIGIDELYAKRFKYNSIDRPCLLLRRENGLENGFILVGCMTALCHTAQISIFSKIPGLEKCKIIKYGRMHRNTFFNAPKILNEFFQIKGTNIFIIGQLSGVDGYAPAIASGLVAAMRIIYGDALRPFPTSTMIGGLARYISNNRVTDFQPMCASFSLIDKSNKNPLEILLNYFLRLKTKS